MIDVMEYLFGAPSFIPHGYSMAWRPGIVTIQVVSDCLIAAAFFSLALTLRASRNHLRGLANAWVFRLFAAFIVLCGAMHLIGVWTLWQPVYGLEGLVKLVTAALAVAVAIVLCVVLPRLLALPSPATLEVASGELADEMRRHRHTAAALRRTLPRLRQHVDNTPLAVIEVEFDNDTLEHGRITLWSGQAPAIFGWTTEEAVDRTVEELGLVLSTDGAEHGDAIADLAAGGTRSMVIDLRCCTRMGAVRNCRCYASLVRAANAGPATVLLLLEDVTEAAEAEERIYRLAHHDTLTGLPNRLLFQDRLNQELGRARRRGEQVALLLLDLDRFKEINDTLGHAAGDALLQGVAARLRENVRETDTWSRLGGDEFALIQTALDDEAAAQLMAERTLEALRPPFAIEEQSITVSASIGVTIAPADGGDVERLLRNADMALYQAKDAGRGTFARYHVGLDQKVRISRSLQERIREALDEDRFELAYQPIVDLESGRAVGREALLRLNHPQGGAIPPAELIAVAETSGLISPLGSWVLGRACRDAAQWSAAGRSLPVAVNLSAIQVRDQDFVGTVERSLAVHRLDPRLVEFEITEGIFLDPSLRLIVDTLKRMVDMGSSLALDDFGTGYSSLAYLKNFPFSTIKVDASFVQGIGRDTQTEAIVRAVLALGQSLGKRVIAEGIETLAQQTFLQANGCAFGQGYRFGRPAPPLFAQGPGD